MTTIDIRTDDEGDLVIEHAAPGVRNGVILSERPGASGWWRASLVDGKPGPRDGDGPLPDLTRADVRALGLALLAWADPVSGPAEAGVWPLLVEMVEAWDAESATPRSRSRHNTALMALREWTRAHLATPPALAVGQALADARVQDGSHVVETTATDERCAEQLRLRQSGRLSSREYDRGRWGDWFASSDLSTAPMPCRLVPIADADLPPATRGGL